MKRTAAGIDWDHYNAAAKGMSDLELTGAAADCHETAKNWDGAKHAHESELAGLYRDEASCYEAETRRRLAAAAKKASSLTGEQGRVLLVLCDAAERCTSAGTFLVPRNGVKLVTTQGPRPIRETTTGAALVRKGYAERLENGHFVATLEGFWLGDTLRAADRRGEIPARRSA